MVKKFIRFILIKISLLLKFDLLFRFIFRSKLIILMYHGISENSISDIRNYGGKLLYKSKFEKQLKFLKKHYNILSLSKAIYLLKKKKLPNNSIVITFDDGLKDNYTVAFELIKKYKVPATFFITIDPISNNDILWIDKIENFIINSDKKRINFNYLNKNKVLNLINSKNKIESIILLKEVLKKVNNNQRICIIDSLIGNNMINRSDLYKYLNWKEVISLSKNNIIEIGAHTLSHPILSRLKVEDLKKEINHSKNIIESKIRKTVNLFSYPNGTKDDFNNMIKDELRKTGYICALTTISGINTEKTDLFELKRINVSNHLSFEDFVFQLSGLGIILDYIKSRIISRIH